MPVAPSSTIELPAKLQCQRRKQMTRPYEKLLQGAVYTLNYIKVINLIDETHFVAVQMNEDIKVMPRPEAATTKISTNSRRLLKYCATIMVAVSLVRPTPMPVK